MVYSSSENKTIGQWLFISPIANQIILLPLTEVKPLTSLVSTRSSAGDDLAPIAIIDSSSNMYKPFDSRMDTFLSAILFNKNTGNTGPIYNIHIWSQIIAISY